MANRREFLQGSIAVSMLALSPDLLAALRELSTAHSPALYKVLFDARVDASRVFASAFAEQGVATQGLRNGDITPFWRDELAAVWMRAPAAVAGLTDVGVLFCLEQLGRQHGLRVLHREQQASGLVAWVVGPHSARNV